MIEGKEMSDDEFVNQINEMRKVLQSLVDGESVNELSDELGTDFSEFNELVFNPPITKIELKYKSPFKLFYNYESDSGFDLYSTEEITIPAFGRVLVPTGTYFDIPPGHEIQVRTKSGLAIKEGLMVLNSPGTVDEGYTGEVKVIIFNVNNHEFTIKKAMKVAQAVLARCHQGVSVDLMPINEIADKDRNENGFGSTGI
jgi:dUTP pyrophosphatase